MLYFSINLVSSEVDSDASSEVCAELAFFNCAKLGTSNGASDPPLEHTLYRNNIC